MARKLSEEFKAWALEATERGDKRMAEAAAVRDDDANRYFELQHEAAKLYREALAFWKCANHALLCNL